MDAAPILPRIAELLNRHGIEVILIGDAAAALQGSPFATLSIAFEFPRSTRTERRLTTVAAELGGILARPPGGSKLRIALPGGLSIDFVPARHPRRCSEYLLNGVPVRVASAPHRLGIIDGGRIRDWQALPPEKRINFLRVRVGLRASCL